MNHFDLTVYLFFVIPLGFVIAADAFFGSLGRFHDTSLTWRNWTLWLALTHTVFPAISYYGFWFIGKHSSWLQESMGVTGFILISIVVYEILWESLGKKPKFGLSLGLSKLFNITEKEGLKILIILSMSWDALSLGPMLITRAIQRDWDNDLMNIAFVIFGLIMFIVIAITLLINKRLREKHFSNAHRLASMHFWGTFASVSFIGSFAITSLWSVFSTEDNWLQSLAVSTVIIIVVFALNWKVIQGHFEEEAEEEMAE